MLNAPLAPDFTLKSEPFCSSSLTQVFGLAVPVLTSLPPAILASVMVTSAAPAVAAVAARAANANEVATGFRRRQRKCILSSPDFGLMQIPPSRLVAQTPSRRNPASENLAWALVALHPPGN